MKVQEAELRIRGKAIRKSSLTPPSAPERVEFAGVVFMDRNGKNSHFQGAGATASLLY
jgi:hypothetical protein